MPFLALIPAKVWAAIGLIALAGVVYLKLNADAERRGATEITTQIQKGQTDARDRAETERRRLDRGDDSRLRGFDRD